MNAIIKTCCPVCGTDMELRFYYAGYGAPNEENQVGTVHCPHRFCQKHGVQYEAPRVWIEEKQK